ncbi:hypothetical protein [Undibacterium sp.]|uniref:hypothetical protein n=1 Tax=Undibacterium sp. TaxID=1914977 RepID=UPI00375324AB
MVSTSTAQQRGKYSEPKRLHGVPGNVYILRNSGLKEGVLQIGLSLRSGWTKALELNRDRANTIPGSFECVFELRAQDGGGAIEAVVNALRGLRCGRSEQDFYEIDLHRAEAIVTQCVRDADVKFQNRYRLESALRDYLKEEQIRTAPAEPAEPDVRQGIFKKSYTRVSKAIN